MNDSPGKLEVNHFTQIIGDNVSRLKPLIRSSLFKLITSITDSVQANITLNNEMNEVVDLRPVQEIVEDKISTLESLIISQIMQPDG